MELSDFNPGNNLGYVTAGEALSRKDLAYLCGLSGKAYAADVTDYAAIGAMTYGTAQTNAATGQIVAQTSIVGDLTLAYSRQAAVKINGDIFALSSYSGINGIKLSKFSASGALLGTVNVDTTAAQTLNHHILELSSGHIAVIYIISGTIKFAIYDANLSVVKALTNISAASVYFSAVALSAGGFAVVYHDAAVSNLLSRLQSYDNSGTAVLAATTVWTRTGTNGNQFHKMVQLSNGDLAIAISSANTVSSIGLYYTIWTTAGVEVKAPTALDATSAAWFPEISTGIAGYFAISRSNATGQKAFVLNNAGTLQGAEFSATTTAGAASNKTKLVSDGTAFYLIWHRNSDSQCVLSKLPTTGTGYTTSIITTSTTQYDFFLDAFCENGYIVAISMAGTGNTAPTMWVVSVATMQLVNVAGTTFGAVPGTNNGNYPRVISGGDRTFIAMYDYATAASTNLCVGKWSTTAILGVVAANAAADARVALYTLAGVYEINAIDGSASKGFDMTTNTLVGNKGAVVAGGAVTLRGIGA